MASCSVVKLSGRIGEPIRNAKPFYDEPESETRQLASEARGESEEQTILTVNKLIDGYRVEKMPKRHDTRRAY